MDNAFRVVMSSLMASVFVAVLAIVPATTFAGQTASADSGKSDIAAGSADKSDKKEDKAADKEKEDMGKGSH